MNRLGDLVPLRGVLLDATVVAVAGLSRGREIVADAGQCSRLRHIGLVRRPLRVLLGAEAVAAFAGLSRGQEIVADAGQRSLLKDRQLIESEVAEVAEVDLVTPRDRSRGEHPLIVGEAQKLVHDDLADNPTAAARRGGHIDQALNDEPFVNLIVVDNEAGEKEEQDDGHEGGGVYGRIRRGQAGPVTAIRGIDVRTRAQPFIVILCWTRPDRTGDGEHGALPRALSACGRARTRPKKVSDRVLLSLSRLVQATCSSG